MNDNKYGAMRRAVQAELSNMIVHYFRLRGYKVPDLKDALGFATAELGEVWEVILQFESGWMRNNKDKEKHMDPVTFKRELGSELGDVIMMAIVAGLVSGVDPVQSLIENMIKHEQHHLTEADLTGFDSAELVNDGTHKPSDEYMDKPIETKRLADGRIMITKEAEKKFWETFREFGDESEDDPYHGEGVE